MTVSDASLIVSDKLWHQLTLKRPVLTKQVVVVFSPFSLLDFGSFSADDFEFTIYFVVFFDFVVLDSTSDSEPASVLSKLSDEADEELEIEEDYEYLYRFFLDLGPALSHISWNFLRNFFSRL